MALLHQLCFVVGMTVPLTGTVMDADGRPAAGASVWLGDTIADHKGGEVLATAQADARGRFRLDRDADLTGRGVSWSPTLWAYRPGSRVAFLEFKANVPGADEPVRLALGPPTATTVRVLQPDGRPSKGASVRIAQVTLKAPRPPDAMLDRLAATTDADGRATIDGLAPEDIQWLDVTTPGQLVQCLAIEPDRETLQLLPTGRLEARVVGDDPKALRGWTITARVRPTEPGYRGPYTTHWASETTGDDGRVAFPPLAAGQVLWEVKAPEGAGDLPARMPDTTIRAGETAAVEIKLVRAVRVEGTVVEGPGGAPVPGVKIHLHPLTHSGQIDPIITDERGHFSILLMPGQVRFSYWLHDMPKTHFLPPHTPHWADFEVKEGTRRQTFAPAPLRRAAQVRGKVLDESGKPVAGVNVSGLWTSAEYGQNPNSIHAQTDARGEFVLGNLAPDSKVEVTATRGFVAESEPVTVPSAGAGGPIALVLRNRPTLALSGRVLDADGRPIAGASVRVKARPRDQPMSSGGDFAFEGPQDIRTGRDGRFKTPAQLPIGYDYRVAAQAPGYEPSESGWVVSPSDVARDVTLRRAIGLRAVAGRVVDSAGKPVAGAEVFQSGDGPRRTRGITDADGRFRVPGVPDAPAFLFVSKEGYHFLGLRVDPADRSVAFTLRRLDEPAAAPLRAVASPVAREEERAIARTLLAEAQKTPISAIATAEVGQIKEMRALVDPDRVVAMIENQVVAAEPNLIAALALARYEVEPRKALELLDAIDSPAVLSGAALRLFDRLGTTASPDFRRELLQRAARRPPIIEDPGQAASLLAMVGDRWLDLGETDGGAGLIRKARLLAEKPRQRHSFDPSGDLALALARIDLPAALKLLEGPAIQPYTLDRIRIGIVNRLAATDPAAARRILGMIAVQHQPSVRRAACLRMAAKDLASARALSAKEPDPMLEAFLPAAAARSRSASDPEGARALLREAIDRLRKLGGGQPVRPSPAVAMARLLPMAARIDPDRAPDVLWLALSLRPPLPALSESVSMIHQSRPLYLDRAELAALVARYDRSAAEAVFAPVADRLAGLDDEIWGLGTEGPAIFRAAGAFDARVARAMLDALPDDPTPPTGPPNGQPVPRHHTKFASRLALAETLATPPGLRLRKPLLRNGEDLFEDLQD